LQIGVNFDNFREEDYRKKLFQMGEMMAIVEQVYIAC
jgi:hypothetical protein